MRTTERREEYISYLAIERLLGSVAGCNKDGKPLVASGRVFQSSTHAKSCGLW